MHIRKAGNENQKAFKLLDPYKVLKIALLS